MRWLLFVLLVGCGRVGFDGPFDGSPDVLAPPACTFGAWTTPQPLAILSSPAGDFGFLKKPEGKGFAFSGPAILDDKIFGVGTGVGMRKADEATLGKKFNAAIDAVQANGTFKKLADKYFDYDIAPRTKQP